MNSQHRFTMLFVLALSFLMQACGVGQMVPTFTPTPTNALVPTFTPTPTNALVPTFTPTPTDALVPTETPTPTLMLTPTPALPVSNATPIPQPGKAIGLDNAQSIVEIAQWEIGKSPDHPSCVAFSADGKILAIGSTNRTVTLLDMITGEEIHILSGHKGIIFDVVFSQDGKLLSSGSEDNTIKLWNVASGELINTLRGHFKSVSSVRFSPDGKLLASSSFDNTIRIWDIASGNPIRTINGTGGKVSSISFVPDGTMLASGQINNSAKLWDVSNGKKLTTLAPSNEALGNPGTLIDIYFKAFNVTFSPDGETLAYSSQANNITLWDTSPVLNANKSCVPCFWQTNMKVVTTLTGHLAWVSSLAFSPDGTLIVSSSGDKTVKVWDAYGGKDLITLTGHRDEVWGMAISSDGRFIASASADGTVRLWGVYP